MVDRLRAGSQLADFQLELRFTNVTSGEFIDHYLKVLNSVRIRNTYRVLQPHGLLAIQNGDSDEAMKNSIAILRWSDLVAAELPLLNYLLSCAVRMVAIDLAVKSLTTGSVSAELRNEFLELLDDQRIVDQFNQAIDGERAYGLSAYHELGWVTGTYPLSTEREHCLDVMADAQRVSRDPFGLNLRVSQSGPIVLSKPLASAVEHALMALRRVQVLHNVVRIVDRWQQQGALAKTTLEQLSLPSDVITDRFDGSTLKWIATSDSITIYSVGDNLVDDGGQIENSLDVGMTIVVQSE